VTTRLVALGHAVGVLLFYGNLLTAWLLYFQSRRGAPPQVQAQLFGLMNRSDRWLTPVSVVLIVGTGVTSAFLLHLPLLSTPWILWSIVAFTGSGLIFVGRLIGLQRALEVAAVHGAATGAWAPDEFRAATSRWAAWAAAGTALALVPLVLMVLRAGSA
jgi:hypothetical protein